MKKYIGIFVSLIASLSTLLGFCFIYIRGNKNKIISSSLAFAGGVMIMISIIDLIPSSILYFSNVTSEFISILYCLTLVIIGVIICRCINNFINMSNSLYKTGIMSVIAVVIHNIPEGIMTYALSTIDLKLGLLFSIIIIMHNIPEGISISIPIYYSTGSKLKAFLYTFISGFGELMGALFCMIFFYKYLSNTFVGFVYSLIAGFMLYIGYFEMLKESTKYESNVNNFALLGALFILILEIIIKL